MTTPAAAPFPWRDIMAFGLGRLGWPPATFWAATPREIAAALRAHRPSEATPPPGREALRALMADHPDRLAQPPDGSRYDTESARHGR